MAAQFLLFVKKVYSDQSSEYLAQSKYSMNICAQGNVIFSCINSTFNYKKSKAISLYIMHSLLEPKDSCPVPLSSNNTYLIICW